MLHIENFEIFVIKANDCLQDYVNKYFKEIGEISTNNYVSLPKEYQITRQENEHIKYPHLHLAKLRRWAMASKSMPKKVYKNTSTENISRCRLCNGVQDPRHCKNLFSNKNQIILKNVALILGEDLPHVDGFPSLVCRPCERRVNNTISFKNIISETQKSLLKDSRSKGCVELSPSVLRPSVKVAAVESRRRSLTFDSANVSTTGDKSSSLVPTEQMSWPMPKNVSQLTLNLINNSFVLNS